MEIINNGLLLNKINPKYDTNKTNEAKPNVNDTDNSSFQNILSNKIEETEPLKFSKHANLRLFDRNLNLTTTQLNRVVDGVNSAREKGVKESLVLVDDIALVVSVKNNTVITATNKNQSNIFTNIDGAVIV